MNNSTRTAPQRCVSPRERVGLYWLLREGGCDGHRAAEGFGAYEIPCRIVVAPKTLLLLRSRGCGGARRDCPQKATEFCHRAKPVARAAPGPSGTDRGGEYSTLLLEPPALLLPLLQQLSEELPNMTLLANVFAGLWALRPWLLSPLPTSHPLCRLELFSCAHFMRHTC